MIKLFNRLIGRRNNSRISLVYSLLLYTITLNSQSLNLIDRIYGGIGDLSALEVNKFGQRFYLFNDLYDSIVINDQYIQLPPKDTIIGSNYFWGRNYLLSIQDTSVFLRRPGGSAIVLNDSSLFVSSTFVEDTLVTEDSIFYNNAYAKGENLLLIQYDYNGNVLHTKHWPSQCSCYLAINNLILDGNEIFFCGEYTSLNEVNLDQSMLVPGYADGFLASMDVELTVNGVSIIRGINEEYLVRMAKNGDSKFLIIGSSSSSEIEFCNDSLYNEASPVWGTSFLFSILYDSFGNCINSKSVDYDYGGIIPTSITDLPDNTFIVSGIYNSTYIALDGITLVNPGHEQRGFIYKFNADGDLINAFQLEGSNGSKRIESVTYDLNGNIWITGMNQADTLRVGEFVLFADSPNEIFGYLARLNSDLKPDFVLKLGGQGYKLMHGQDENIYLIETLIQANDDFRVYKIITSPNYAIFETPLKDVEISIYPNPSINAGYVSYSFLTPGNRLIDGINVYNLHGILIESGLVNSNHGIINLPPNQNVLFVEFLINNGSKVTKKLFARK